MQEQPLKAVQDLDKVPSEDDKARPGKDSLKISELFFSLQGESSYSGLPTVFVRLTGCPLRCVYCDSEYAFYGGEWMTFEQIEARIASYKTQHVCITGGEPLAQRACLAFMQRLCDQGYKVSLETAGALDVSRVDSRVMKVMDLKTPESAEAHRNRYGNLKYLNPGDQIKFVICSRLDYDWVKEQIEQYKLTDICEVLLSASYEQLKPKDLADWIIEDALPVRFQLQVHKYLWGDIPGV